MMGRTACFCAEWFDSETIWEFDQLSTICSSSSSKWITWECPKFSTEQASNLLFEATAWNLQYVPGVNIVLHCGKVRYYLHPSEFHCMDRSLKFPNQNVRQARFQGGKKTFQYSLGAVIARMKDYTGNLGYLSHATDLNGLYIGIKSRMRWLRCVNSLQFLLASIDEVILPLHIESWAWCMAWIHQLAFCQSWCCMHGETLIFKKKCFCTLTARFHHHEFPSLKNESKCSKVSSLLEHRPICPQIVPLWIFVLRTATIL